VLSNTAVLDRETGIVWERAPNAGTVTWATANEICHGLTKGGRTGWRLATIEELMSLWDLASAPRLPAGHPFSGVATLSTDWYWSQSTGERNDALASTLAYTVSFGLPMGPAMVQRPKTESRYFWCVRGSTEHNGP
jgi:hypothetical protein